MEENGIFYNLKHKRSADRKRASDKDNRVKQIGSLFGTAQAGRIYDPSGLCPTLGTMQGGWKVPLIKV